MNAIASRTSPATCIVIGCRRTGKPREANGEFICTTHLKACPSADLTKHAEAASALKAISARYELRGGDKAPVVRAEIREINAWRTLRTFIAGHFGIQTKGDA
jgi:hypothetical protein